MNYNIKKLGKSIWRTTNNVRGEIFRVKEKTNIKGHFLEWKCP